MRNHEQRTTESEQLASDETPAGWNHEAYGIDMLPATDLDFVYLEAALLAFGDYRFEPTAATRRLPC